VSVAIRTRSFGRRRGIFAARTFTTARECVRHVTRVVMGGVNNRSRRKRVPFDFKRRATAVDALVHVKRLTVFVVFAGVRRAIRTVWATTRAKDGKSKPLTGRARWSPDVLLLCQPPPTVHR